MLNKEQAAEELAKRMSTSAVVRRDEPLAKRTTLRVGGPADVFVEPASDEDLAGVLKFCSEHGMKFFVLGRGSNLVVRNTRGVCLTCSSEVCESREYFGLAIFNAHDFCPYK